MNPPTHTLVLQDGFSYAALKRDGQWFFADGTGWVSGPVVDTIKSVTEITNKPELPTTHKLPTNYPQTALDTQVNGDHYKNMAIQPIEFIHANKLGYCEGNVVKYITRWRNKNGVADLEKAKHYIDLLIELEGLNAHLDAQEGVNSPPERP